LPQDIVHQQTCPPANKCISDNWIFRAKGNVERIEAFFTGNAYSNHRHDSYAISIALSGTQCFNYRGASRINAPGHSMILHPDELHDGQAGTVFGMRYRVAYVEPVAIQNVLQGAPLPFIESGISDNPKLYQAVVNILGDLNNTLEGLEYQDAIYDLATAMQQSNTPCKKSPKTYNFHAAKLVREYIVENLHEIISMDVLEEISDCDRWQLSRDFRALFGTSPYRYLLLRRLDKARNMLLTGYSAADTAITCNFSDQSHMNRHFKKTFGLTPKKLTNSIKSLRPKYI